ncbi:MAG: calcium-binding protein [Gemmataceae bacterium]
MRPTTLRLESLECRTVPTAVTFWKWSGDLRIDGDAGSNQVVIKQRDGAITVTEHGAQLPVTIRGQQNEYLGTTYGSVALRNINAAWRIVVSLGEGNDYAEYRSELSSAQSSINSRIEYAYFYCGGGNDVVFGTPGNDVMFGEAGNDQLYGLDGNDTLDGGLNDDILEGGRDNNVLRGGAGNDRLIGGSWFSPVSGNNVLDGGGDNDTVTGGTGNDFLYGGAGNDVLHGGDGNDRLWGDAGSDRLYGDAGNDFLEGGAGIDVHDGGTGADVVYYGVNDTFFWDRQDRYVWMGTP